MDETTLNTAVEFLNKYNNFLIAVPEIGVNIDKIVSSLSLCLGLETIGKTAQVVTSGQVPERLSFLSEVSKVEKLVRGSSKLTVLLNTQHAELSELSYEQLPGQVSIYLQAKNGQFKSDDVSVKQDRPNYDAIVTVGAETLEQLGETFANNTDLFYTLPRLNLDVSAENQSHGTTNVVVVNSSSISELMYQTIVALKEEIIPKVATLLLTGILSATSSLKNNRTTPKTFAATADLTAAGGAYDTVIKYLYKNERLGLLKLWGRSLAKLVPVSGKSAAYVVLNPEDFDKTGEKPIVIKDILAEFDANVHEYRNIVVVAVWEDNYTIAALLHPQLLQDKFINILGLADYAVQSLDSGCSYLLGHGKFAQADTEIKLVEALSSSIVS